MQFSKCFYLKWLTVMRIYILNEWPWRLLTDLVLPLQYYKGRRTHWKHMCFCFQDSTLLRTSVQSKVCVSMVFFGKTVHLSHDLMDMRDEVKVFQQHCGGENLCVYKGRVQEGGEYGNMQEGRSVSVWQTDSRLFGLAHVKKIHFFNRTSFFF